MAEWGMEANEWKEWLGSKETELDNQGAVGSEPAVVRQQKNDLEVKYYTMLQLHIIPSDMQL